MKRILVSAFLLSCSIMVFGWGKGHDDHVKYTLEYLPKEIKSTWSSEQQKKLIHSYSHIPDSGVKLISQDKRYISVLPKDDLELLEKLKAGTYKFHKDYNMLAFYLLVKAFRENNSEASAIYSGILLHTLADLSAFNHAPLLHYYSYSKYKHIEFPKFVDDLSYVRNCVELQNLIKDGMKGFTPKIWSDNLHDALFNILVLRDLGCGKMSEVEHKSVMKFPKNLEGMADIAVFQIREGVNTLLTAWTIAKSQQSISMPIEDMLPKGKIIKEFNQQKNAKEPRSPKLDGVYDGLFEAGPKTPAIGIICEATAEMNHAQLGYGSRFLSAISARTIKEKRAIKMISLTDLKKQKLSPESTPIILFITSGNIPAYVKKSVQEYLKLGGKIIMVGGVNDSKITTLSSYFQKRQNNELPVSNKYGVDNQEIYSKMYVIDEAKNKYYLNDNPNTKAGWNKPFSNITLKASDDFKCLYALNNGKETFCIAAHKGNSVWLPAYLLMPFLFSKDKEMSDWAHPTLDTFGKSVIFTAIENLER